MAKYQIFTRGMPSRADEWLRVLKAPTLDLPALSEDDKQSARIRHLTDEQYARHLMLHKFTRQREQQEAELLGKTIIESLKELGDDFQLMRIWKRGLDPGWRAVIERRSRGSERVFDVGFPTENFSEDQNEEILNLGDTEQIRNYLLAQLGVARSQSVAS